MSFFNKSETLSWVSGGKKSLPLDFLDRVGPRTGRATIAQFLIKCSFSITTPAANTIAGADFAGLVKRLRIYDAIGNRFYLTGAKARAVAHMDMGDAVPADPANFAASTTATVNYYLYVNFAQYRAALRAFDCGLPVDDLQNGGGFELEMPAATDLFQTGGPCTINSGSYTIYVKFREEWDVEFHQRDVREELSVGNQTFLYSVGNGRMLRSLFLYKEGAGGGLSLAGLTDFTIDPLRFVVMERDVYKQLYLGRGLPVLQAQDPFYNDKAFAIIFPEIDNKLSDDMLIPGQLPIRMNNSVALPFDCVAHYIAPTDERMMQATAVTNAIDPSTLKIKTQGKTSSMPAAWGNLAAFMPKKANRS